eukprot:m.102665 g.102665  ORF g.102665 m.102665 type:complete len:112 (+) comp20831_c0_seq1:292-627(+)
MAFFVRAATAAAVVYSPVVVVLGSVYTVDALNQPSGSPQIDRETAEFHRSRINTTSHSPTPPSVPHSPPMETHRRAHVVGEPVSTTWRRRINLDSSVVADFFFFDEEARSS